MNATVGYLHPWDPLDGLRLSDVHSTHNASSTTNTSSSLYNYGIHWTFFTLIALLCLYIYSNDKKLRTIPHEAVLASPTRFTTEGVLQAAEHVERMDTTHPILEHLPPRSGRRYIIVGGAGFAGGWMVLHLLHRGESPANIRILDLRRPTRPDLKEGQASLVDFVQCDISNSDSVYSAFLAPWPSDADTNAPLTVFHTAANIRFYERHPALLLRSAHINIGGTQNVIDACRAAGASVLIYTSSGSVAVRNTRFLLWPWEKSPERFVQSFSDTDKEMPSAHDEFFANYAYTKIKAEELVKAADGTTTNGVTLRTGAIRPGNGVYGPGGDLLCGAFLVRRVNPTWIDNVVENFCAVEVVSQAHLCYEQRLIDLTAGAPNPDIGGQSFIVTDPGPPVTYGDVFLALKTLCPETVFPLLSATGMLLMAHVVEAFYLLRELLVQSPSGIMKAIGLLIPRIKGELVNMQPSVWSLVMVHLLFDGSRARLPAEQGGLGLTGGLSTLESLCLLVKAHQKNKGKSEARSQSGGMSLSWGFFAMGKKA